MTDDTIESGMEPLISSTINNGSPPRQPENMEVQHDSSNSSSDDYLMDQEFVVAEKSWSNETSDTLLEGCLKKPCDFLIKMPKFYDEMLKEQIRLAQLYVDEMTQSRDAIWQEIKKKRENCQHYGVEFEAAKTEERAARKQIRSKRAEIENLQIAINRVKNAISIEDIDARICSMEHMIHHESLPLIEENNLIREIKQLKQLRDQLSSNIGSCVEVQQALDNRAQIEDNLKNLKSELHILKNKVSEVEAVVVAVSLKYEEESKTHKELRDQYKAANELRQAARGNLQNLRKALFEKNKHFRMYKDDSITASKLAASKDTEALHHLCANQVEKFMDLWNGDEEFRKEYVRSNMRSTIRRFGTLDGRSLDPDESPLVLLPVYDVAERTRKLGSKTLEVDLVSPNEARNPTVKVAGNETEDQETVKCNLENVDTGSGWDGRKDDKAEDVQTKEELELAWKEEGLRKLEIAVRLKEQRRLEEIIKAKEALERKKRNAEKAQLRAELRAQKEAEQKEKEREKRLRKKERKNEGGPIGDVMRSGINMNENESREAAMDECGQATVAAGKKTHQCTKQSKTKSTPLPPLRNKSKRRLQQWLRIILTSIVVIVLFLLGNIGFFASLKQRQNVP
ncbi:unnamed protein product [Cuscuta epithymum]|uniref:Proton pump-interactor 1 n=2 Tax=Cuscuta epithymum TaxID=186058 RepID=A0AAV0EV46_9ASTE|nr:unnamed protein product [Cuscuta epithymum]